MNQVSKFRVAISRLLVAAAILSATIIVSGCGKFKAPVVPEAVTPDMVATLQASATKGAIILTWSSPMVDRRDKKLKNLDGYRVERKKITSSADIDPEMFAVVGPKSGFELVGELEDKSLVSLEELRSAALASGKPTRRLTAEADLTTFRFEDTNIALGEQFIYRVIPVNDYGFGRISRLARVVFRGVGSEFTYPEPVLAEEDLSFNPFR